MKRTKIVVDAAHGAVVIQSGVIDDLRRQIDALRSRISDLESQAADSRALCVETKP